VHPESSSVGPDTAQGRPPNSRYDQSRELVVAGRGPVAQGSSMTHCAIEDIEEVRPFRVGGHKVLFIDDYGSVLVVPVEPIEELRDGADLGDPVSQRTLVMAGQEVTAHDIRAAATTTGLEVER
jgi:hypothetical protein